MGPQVLVLGSIHQDSILGADFDPQLGSWMSQVNAHPASSELANGYGAHLVLRADWSTGQWRARPSPRLLESQSIVELLNQTGQGSGN